MVALFGTLILLPLYMQNVLKLDTLTTGLLLLPGGIVMGVLAPFVGRIYDRFGLRVLLVAGTIITSAVLWSLTQVDENTPIGLLLTAHIVLSFGLALTFTPLFTSALGSLPKSLYSHGSAILGTIQQLAGAVGTAVFISVMSSQAATLMAGGTNQISATASGVQSAFLIGAIVSLLAIPAAFIIQKPADSLDDASFAGH
jgi:DHA2 family lincomycin resistance protein-like MFS transporter